MINEIKTIPNRILEALISSIILALILSSIFYIPESQQNQGTIYWSFIGLILIYLIYSVPVFIIGGIPFSIIADYIIDKKVKVRKTIKYLIKLLIYAFGGLLISVLFVVIVEGNVTRDALKVLIIGIVAAEINLHIKLIIGMIRNYKGRK